MEADGVTVRFLYKNTLNGYHYHGAFPFFRKNSTKYDASNKHFYSSNSSYQKVIDELEWGKMNHKGGGFMLGDNCDGFDNGDDTAACLERFFSGSKATDILIFSLGWVYAGYNKNEEDDTPIDYRAWLLHSAVRFYEYLERYFEGQIFWFTIPPTHPDNIWNHMNPGIVQINDLLWQLWRPHAGNRSWYVIDQGAINKDRFNLYNDEIHFHGNLTFASLYNILNMVCR